MVEKTSAMAVANLADFVAYFMVGSMDGVDVDQVVPESSDNSRALLARFGSPSIVAIEVDGFREEVSVPSTERLKNEPQVGEEWHLACAFKNRIHSGLCSPRILKCQIGRAGAIGPICDYNVPQLNQWTA